MDLTPDFAKVYLDYNPDSGDLVWISKASKNTIVGTQAGCLRPDGYLTIGLGGKTYLAHRLIWFMETGAWPLAEIDHANLARSDNRFHNLREATSSENRWNGRKPATNTSGFKGVTWHKGKDKWQAQIKMSNQTLFLGLFDDPVLAHAAYVAAAQEHFGEFARAA